MGGDRGARAESILLSVSGSLRMIYPLDSPLLHAFLRTLPMAACARGGGGITYDDAASHLESFPY